MPFEIEVRHSAFKHGVDPEAWMGVCHPASPGSGGALNFQSCLMLQSELANKTPG